MNTPLLSSQRETLRPLTSLRFFAALLVVLYHCQPTAAIGAAYALGHAGVGFFFVLSGFILTYSYHGSFDGPLAWDRVRAFYVARMARIYPLHIVAMILAVAVLGRFGATFWNSSNSPTRWLAAISQSILIQSWIPNEKVYFGINSPAWSISVEAFFYVMFPFLLAWLSRSFEGKSPRAILLATALLWSVSVTIALVPHRITVWAAYVVPPIRLLDFLVGMMVAIAFLRKREFTTRISGVTILEAAAITAAACAILASPGVPEVLRYALFLMPFWAFLIWIFVWQQGAISRVLSQPLFVRLGEASFALYLVHWPVIQIVTHTVGWEHAIPSIVLMFVMSLGLSVALFHLVEQPLRIRIRMAFSRPKVSQSVAAAEALG